MAPRRAARIARSLAAFGAILGARTGAGPSLGCSRAARPRDDVSSGVAALRSGDTAVDAAPIAPALSAAATTASASPGACGDPGEVTIIASPDRPIAGRPLRVVAVTDRPVDATLSIAGPSPGAGALAETAERTGGPPYAWFLEVASPPAGRWHATLTGATECDAGGSVPRMLAERDGAVARGASPPPGALRTSLWRTRRSWSRGLENVYSAWVAHLFAAPPDEEPTFSALHEVLSARSRNFLFDHLGEGEDELGAVIRPDCADLPYFLRAYFAFKLGLPFGWSRCTRGETGAPPRCSDFATNEDPLPPGDAGPPPWADPDREKSGPWESSMRRVVEFLRTTLADAVQSGAGRTAAADEDADYYPVSLSAETLRPGTIFADPYGHVLVVTARVAQRGSAPGVLYAVDGQPDGTVARKRFWRGNFLFAIDPALGAAGFKRFRPVVRDRATGRLVRRKYADLADYSPVAQYEGGVEGFYDKVEDVLSPAPLDPDEALLETIRALDEQVRARVVSVDNGRRSLPAGRKAVDMPEGERIFETVGEWEDFATPSRDMRLLIAMDVARSLPVRLAQRPSRYRMPPGVALDDVRRGLEERLARELAARTFQYVRTDGSTWALSLAQVVEREAALEAAYNPNDCVELRWGAPPGSDEASTCAAHAPEAQQRRMARYRAWFHDRKRPAR